MKNETCHYKVTGIKRRFRTAGKARRAARKRDKTRSKYNSSPSHIVRICKIKSW